MGFDIGTDLLPLADAARVLKISRATLFRYLRQGRIASIEHGGRRFIERAEIEDYFARCRADGRKQRNERARRAERGTRGHNRRKTRSEYQNDPALIAPEQDAWCGGTRTVAQLVAIRAQDEQGSHPSGQTA
jgi:excisionase family DNA binding protein